MEIVLAIIYTIMIVGVIGKALFSRDMTAIFSPLVFLCVYFSYYILYPYYTSTGDVYDLDSHTGIDYLFLAAIINFLGILLGYNCYHPYKYLKSNSLYTLHNGKYIAICMLSIAVLAYFSFNGFNFRIVRAQTETYNALEHRFGHSEDYLVMLISLLPSAAILFYMTKSKKWLTITLIFALIIGILGGSRYRLLLFVIPLITAYHLYPMPKKINYLIWVPVGIAFILMMGIIEKTRNYGSGLDSDRMSEILSTGSVKEIKASEAEFVYYFSAKVLDKYQDDDIMPWDVFGTALCFPLPRALFPWKPDAQYLRDANIRVLGTEAYGAAYLNIVEWFLALGWVGVLLNGIILGLLSKFFWNNYKRNPNTLGGVLYLCLFDGVCYVLVSRGYLAQELLVFIYYLPVTYWMSCLFLKLRTITIH